jgi:tetratricopeptide (TPR) repeat protein
VLRRATGFVDRLRGLLGSALPDAGCGLWLEPCGAVHSFGMRGAIDLLFVDRDGRVVAVRAGFAPWRTASCRAACSTIELRAGEAARLRIEAGAVLKQATSLSEPVPDRHRAGHSSVEQESAMTKQIETKISRRPTSRQARAAAIAAVAAASLVSSSAKADAAAGMNLGYDFRDPSPAAPPPPTPATPTTAEAPLTDAAPADAAPPSGTPASAADTSANGAQATGAQATDAPAVATVRPVPEPSAERRLAIGDRLAEAEALYRGSRFDEALPAFRAIVDADPDHAHAWLRIGNLLHRKRDWFDALSAYRRAARPQADPVIREKAVYNVALLNLELARQAIKRLDRIRADINAGQGGAPNGAGVSDGAVGRLSDQVGISYRALSGARAGAAPGGQKTAAAASGSSFEPGSAPAPAPGPRAPQPAPPEKPVEVEIRQGGVTR